MFNINNEIDFIIGLSLSVVAGFFIGAERKMKNKPVGISTISLVIAGSMVFTNLTTLSNFNNPVIIAHIISGIGFLGAGIIFKKNTEHDISNVTTAAVIWFAASIGITIGLGEYIMALILIAFGVIVPRLPNITDLLSKYDKINKQ